MAVSIRGTRARSRAVPAESTAFDYSAHSQNFNDPDVFVAFCAGYPNPAACVTFIYRLVPKIDREQVAKRESYLEKVTGEMVDVAYIARKWGSGRYHLMFNDSNRVRPTQQVARCTFTLEDPAAPPVFDPAELVVGLAENEPYVARYLNQGWMVQEVKNDLKPAGFKQLVAPGSSSSNGADKVLAETVQQLAARAGEGSTVSLDRDTLAALLAARSSGPDFEQVIKVAERLNPRGPDPLAQMSTIADVIHKLRPAGGGGESSDPLASLNSMADVMTKFGWTPPGGGSSSGGGSGMMRLLENVLGQVASGFGAALAARIGGGASLPLGVGVPAPSEAIPAAPVVGGGIASQAPPAGPVTLTPQLAFQVAAAAVQSFEGGETGDMFAERLSGHNEGLYDAIASRGVDPILSGINMLPDVAARVAGKEPQLRAWVKDFVDYGFGPYGPPDARVEPDQPEIG